MQPFFRKKALYRYEWALQLILDVLTAHVGENVVKGSLRVVCP